MNLDDIKFKIEKAVPGAQLKVVRESLLLENADSLLNVAVFLKNSDDFRFDYLSSVTATDYIQHLETVYHFYSIEKREGALTLRVRCPKDQAKVPSLTPLYRGAEFQERENYDMYGIVYTGHPDLRRLFMWEGFEAEDIAWLDKNGVKVSDDLRAKADSLKREGKRAVAQKPGQPEPA